MPKIDPLAPDPMNRFHGMDTADALEVVDGMLAGTVYPEVTLWRLRSYCEMAIAYGRILERKERQEQERGERAQERMVHGGPPL